MEEAPPIKLFSLLTRLKLLTSLTMLELLTQFTQLKSWVGGWVDLMIVCFDYLRTTALLNLVCKCSISFPPGVVEHAPPTTCCGEDPGAWEHCHCHCQHCHCPCQHCHCIVIALSLLLSLSALSLSAFSLSWSSRGALAKRDATHQLIQVWPWNQARSILINFSQLTQFLFFMLNHIDYIDCNAHYQADRPTLIL